MDRIDEASTANQADFLIGDLAKFLVRWAKLQDDERTGNQRVSEGLRLLAACLRPHKSKPISELANLRVAGKDETQRRSEARKPAFELPSNLASVTLESVTEILRNVHVQKKQLIELAGCRFGIPASTLSRLKRAEAIAAIEAAVEHETSLAAIERNARLAGQRRVA